MTTSKFISGGRYWLTASGDIMKHGLIASEVLRVRAISSRTGRCRDFFIPSRRITPGSPIAATEGLRVFVARMMSLVAVR
ncbi:MAG: hypothetical protein WA488_15900, partial [Mycobacterium sp.]|uniref:hypothetical protein n=1 Tax=Mycobacterium sp. TaxID=1785 RepID=UPI003CA58CDD